MDYLTHCLKCEHQWEQSHRMVEPHAACPRCRSKSVESVPTADVRVNPPLDRGWEYLNGGRGQYFSQLEPVPTGTPSPSCHFRSRHEALEACKRRGFNVISK